MNVSSNNRGNVEVKANLNEAVRLGATDMALVPGLKSSKIAGK